MVKQEVTDVAPWDKVFRDPELDDVDRARAFAASITLASTSERVRAIGSPAGVWYGPTPVG